MTKNPTRRAVVILAAGRTGSSLLMQILQRLGMSVSAEMTPASEQNIMGGYEDMRVFTIHSQILRLLNASQYFPLPENWMETSGIKTKQDELSNIIKDEITKSSTIWGFKDPRTALFLPLWIQIFNSQKIVPCYFLAVRSPEASVASYSKQYNRDKQISELFWLYKNCTALYHTGGNCHIVHYEDWFTRPGELAQELLKYSGLDQFFTGDVDECLKEVIKPNLNRAGFQEHQIQNEHVLKFYDVLKDCKGNDFDRESLMGVVNKSRKAMDDFKGWYLEAQRKTDELHIVLERDLKKKFKDQIKALEAEHEKALQKMEERTTDMEHDLHEITLQNNGYLKQIKDLHDEKENLYFNLSSIQNNQKQTKKLKKSWIKPKQAPVQKVNAPATARRLVPEEFDLRNTYSYRLGQVFVSAVARPGKNTVMLPFRFIRILFEFLIHGRQPPHRLG